MQHFVGSSDFSRQDSDEAHYGKGNLLLWAAGIAILIGLNFASWSFCMWVFGQPEHAFNYRILTKLNNLEPLKGFTAVTAPRGKFLSVKDIYARAYPLDDAGLRVYNGMLKRRYIHNFKGPDDVVFLSGDFVVEDSRPMGRKDVFANGYVIRGRSTTFPDAYVDFALPTELKVSLSPLTRGEVFRIEESSTCAVVLNIDRLSDGAMVFTVVPLVERTYEFSDAVSVAVKIPPRIQIEPERWPISHNSDSADKAADQAKSLDKLAAPMAADSAGAANEPQEAVAPSSDKGEESESITE